MSADRPTVVAVDVGGTTIKGARVAADDTVVARDVRPTPAGPNAVVAAVRSVVAALLSDDVVAVGLAVPGEVDSSAGVARYSANLGWRDVPVGAFVPPAFDGPTVLGHDVRAAALADRTVGASRDVEDALIVVLGTGVAAVAVTGGRPVDGATHLAGELGHLAVVADGEPCPCGQRGCLERYASAPAIVRHYRDATGVDLDAATIGARRDRDPAAARAWSSATDTLATGLAAATMLLDPAIIVLAGGLSAAGDALVGPVVARLDELVRFRSAPLVVVSPLGADAGRTGAALLAWRAVDR